jgi:hypothetical protein
MLQRYSAGMWGVLVVVVSLLGLPAAPVGAADLAAPTAPPPQAGRPGLIRLGPFHLTPNLRIGSIGVDTNVFYTASERRSDLTASGGPGLRLVVPIAESLRLVGEGGVGYVYFARTVSQRRWIGDGRGALEWATERTSATAEILYKESFLRPSIEIDRRVAQESTVLRASVRRRLFGRTSVALAAAHTEEETPSGQDFLGTDLGRTLTRDSDAAVAALEYALTIKTALVFEGTYERSRFVLDRSRDADTLRARTAISGRYERDIVFTAFIPTEGSPALHDESFSVRLRKELPHNFDLRLHWQQRRSRSEDPVLLELSGEVVEGRRDDRATEYGADLGYRFGQHVRIGVTAAYSERRSPFADLGVDGLLLGATFFVTP